MTQDVDDAVEAAQLMTLVSRAAGGDAIFIMPQARAPIWAAPIH